MFVELGQVEDRRWLLPSCPVCPPPPHVQWKLTYEDLRESGEKGCEKCKLFTHGIDTICPPGARLQTVEWVWSYSVLSGRDRDLDARGEAQAGRESVYEIEMMDSKTTLVPDAHLPTEFHVGHPVPDRRDLDETLSQIRSWYSSCVEPHDNRRPDSAPYVPTRLLDIGSSLCESGVQLLETRVDIPGADVDYVCLSHCWGKIRPDCITLKRTLANNRKGVRWTAVMCNVYSGAALTLAATNAPDSHHGLHSALSPDYQSYEFFMHLNDGRTKLPVWRQRPIPHFVNSETHTARQNEIAPLLQRGRVVHFANNEVAWECLHRCECQCLGGNNAERFANPKVVLSGFLHGPRTQYTTDHPAAQWLEIVEEYTSLALTFTKDRLPALSGAAQRSRQYRDGDDYVAGLWKSEILLGLTWCSHGLLRERPREWIAPLWSWASIDSGVWWPGKHLEVVKEFLTLVEVKCVLAGLDPTGRLTSASIVVRGPAATGMLTYENDDTKLDRMFSVQFGSRKMTGCLWPDYLLRASDDEHLVPQFSEIVWLAVLDVLLSGGRQHEYAGLLLRQSVLNPQAFERIGRLRIESTEDHNFMMERAVER
ncbi:heterokaryon incompatibility protein-domain-containing protein [Xylaria digitata]|nr:heterokaryon incompatibility protein-domain-containing protein [Xylaria digitata]